MLVKYQFVESSTEKMTSEEALSQLKARLAYKNHVDIALLLSPPPQADFMQVGSAVEQWFEKVQSEDRAMGIERYSIPRAYAWIPNTPQGQAFYQLAQAIAATAKQDSLRFKTCAGDLTLSTLKEKLALGCGLQGLKLFPSFTTHINRHDPKLQKRTQQQLEKAKDQLFNQICYLKTIQSYWQAQGLLFAYQYFKEQDSSFNLIPNPVGDEGVLRDHFPKTAVNNLIADVAIELSFYQLICGGQQEIDRRLSQQNLANPFASSLNLFLQILREQFQSFWQLGPLNLEAKFLDRAQQRENLRVRLHWLRGNSWDGKRNGEDQEAITEKYERFLQGHGWEGQVLLALREPGQKSPLNPSWKRYIKAMTAGLEQYVDEFQWRDGFPYKTRRTSKIQPIQAEVTESGYIQWVWA